MYYSGKIVAKEVVSVVSEDDTKIYNYGDNVMIHVEEKTMKVIKESILSNYLIVFFLAMVFVFQAEIYSLRHPDEILDIKQMTICFSSASFVLLSLYQAIKLLIYKREKTGWYVFGAYAGFVIGIFVFYMFHQALLTSYSTFNYCVTVICVYFGICFIFLISSIIFDEQNREIKHYVANDMIDTEGEKTHNI